MSARPEPERDAAAERAPRWWWWRVTGRAAPEQPDGEGEDGPGAEVVALYPDRGHVEPGPVEPADQAAPPSAMRLWVARQARPLLPHRDQLAMSARYYAATLPPALGRAAVRAPWAALAEIVPVWHGFVAVADTWYGWAWCAELRAELRRDDKQQYTRLRDIQQTTRLRMGWLTGGGLVAAGGLVWWAWVYHPVWVIVAGVAVVGGLDLLGRHVRKPDEPDEPAPRQIRFVEGMPLRSITRGILDALAAEGVRVEVTRLMVWDPNRQEYRLGLGYDPDEDGQGRIQALKPEHLRAVERWCGFADHAIRMLGTDTAAERDLVVRVGDPLAKVGKAPWQPTGSRSIADPLDMGGSASDVPYAVKWAGTHAIVLGTTGSGKTKGTIWTAIDRLSGCRDAALLGIDLQQGPALPMWRGVIQRAAYTPEDAAALLGGVITEVQRRMRILQAIAEDDDPTNDTDEWDAALAAAEGPAWVLVIDEFSLLAAYDGKGGKLDLLTPVVQIARTGRKVWVTLLLGTQNTGTGDTGATQLWKQLGLKFAGPCELSDATALFGKDKRDAGWTPHLLQQAQDGDVRDAGKVFIDGPGFTTPDIFRSYAPLTTREVKERARRRLDDGLPALSGGVSTIDAREVPECLAVIDAAFRDLGSPEVLSAEQVAEFAAANGLGWDQRVRSELRDLGVVTRAKNIGGSGLMRYFREDVAAALEGV
ncbi:MAG: hypothetical protein ACRD0V_09140 [Acidimicrobiales bacterium]